MALERISQAFRVLLWEEGKQHALSPIQIQLIIFLHFHSEDKRRVGYLAREFNMTKATISDSIKVLEQKGLVVKYGLPGDARGHILALSSEGESVAIKAMSFANAITTPVSLLSDQQKLQLLTGLLDIIHNLQRSGIISLQRMCFTCRHYGKEESKHFCHLMNKPLMDTEIRIDCPEHEFAG